MVVAAPAADEARAVVDRPVELRRDLAVCLALAVVSVPLRLRGLAPSSLWLDDAWVALASRVDSVHDAFYVGPTAPGFAVLLFLWTRIVGHSNVALQAIPWVAGVLGGAAVFVTARMLGIARLPATLAGLLLATCVTHAGYSVAVKQYSVDAVLSCAIVGLALLAIDQPNDRRRWLAFTVVGALGSTISAAMAPVAVGAAAVAGLVALRQRAAIIAAPAIGALGAFLAAWWAVVLLPRANPVLHDFWVGYYVTSAHDVRLAAQRFVQGFSSGPWPLTAALLVLAMGVLAVRRPARLALLALPVVAAMVLAALEISPIGTPRTDIYLYPLLALVVAAAVDRAPLVPRGMLLTGAALVVAANALTFQGAARDYPQQDVRPLVSELEESVRPGDRIVVYPITIFAFSLYTSWPVHIRPDAHNNYATGFRSTIGRKDVLVLQRTPTSAVYEDQLRAPLARSDRVWVIASHIDTDIQDVDRGLRDLGFAPSRTDQRPGAFLSLWERTGA
jgi:hypothetical protein